MDTPNFLMDLLLRAPGILIGLTIHEYAHGLVALWRGDPTAQQEGRLTLNPVAHLDPIGTLPLLLGPFGWAKPVPVNYYNLNNPKRDMVFISLAGPLSNILFAGIICLLLHFWNPSLMDFTTGNYLFRILQIAFVINIGLSFFNLLPIPPLDGSQILMGFLPNSKIPGYLNSMRHVPMVFFAGFFIEWALHIPVISWVFNPLFIPYLSFWQFIFSGGKAL
jgi:Zn-dependent protease